LYASQASGVRFSFFVSSQDLVVTRFTFLSSLLLNPTSARTAGSLDRGSPLSCESFLPFPRNRLLYFFSSSELTDVLDPSLQTAPLFSVSIVSKPTKISTLVERGFYWLFDLGNTLTFSASDKRLLHMRTLELLARMEKRVIGVQDR